MKQRFRVINFSSNYFFNHEVRHLAILKMFVCRYATHNTEVNKHEDICEIVTVLYALAPAHPLSIKVWVEGPVGHGGAALLSSALS